VDQSRVAVFGTGVMGYGIALLCLGRGLSVVVLSGSPDRAGALVERLQCLVRWPHGDDDQIILGDGV